MAFTQVSIEVSKRENGKFAKVGNVNIFVPVIPQDILPIIASAEIEKNEKGEDVYQDGIPVFKDKRANWIQDAILAAVKMQARNKLESGTATLKSGAKIAEDWDELTAEGTRGPGAANALAKEFRETFSAWVAKQGLSEKASATLVQFVSNKAALSLQPQANKDKVKARLDAFAESLSSEDMEKFMKPLESIMEACEESADAMDEL